METIGKEWNRVFLHCLPTLQTLDLGVTISMFNLFPLTLTSSHTNFRPSCHNPLKHCPLLCTELLPPSYLFSLAMKEYG